MYMDQVYQIRAIMEATGAVKDAPVIRELLDEALAGGRRLALPIGKSRLAKELPRRCTHFKLCCSS